MGGLRPDFKAMHQNSKHATHVLEVLSVTVETMEGIQRQQDSIYRSLPSGLAETDREQAQEYMKFQLQMMKNLKVRASSNHERLQSEIKLVTRSLSSFILPTPALGMDLTRVGIQR
jgi:hypothetical protein